MKKTTKKQLFSLFLIVAFLGSTLTFALLNAFQDQEKDVWVARISILIFGKLETIPAQVGISNNKTQKVFTVAADNLVYKTVNEEATLKDFFEIWGENFNSTCVLEYCNNANSSLRMYVNNAENFEYEFYTIKDKDNIIIDYR